MLHSSKQLAVRPVRPWPDHFFCRACKIKPAIRAIYSEIVTLVWILLVIPVTNATGERTFSALR